MTIRIWGARGSVPAPGPETQIYGGNTSCITVASENTLLVLDAGSGIRRLGNSALVNKYSVIHILLTHLHMDHILGLGFFNPLYNPNAEINIWGPASFNQSLLDRLNRYLSPPLFPVNIKELPAKVHFQEVTNGFFEIGDFKIYANYVCHPGPTLGFRIEHNNKVIAFIPDHELAWSLQNQSFEPDWTSGFDIAHKADLLIHDAQFSNEDYNLCVGWGHSTFLQALRFARMAKTEKLLFFHHDPNYSDSKLEGLAKKYLSEIPYNAEIAREGTVFEL